MDAATLDRLEKLNQLKLSADEQAELTAFFEKADKDIAALNSVNTDNVERMVHVMPMTNIIREDVEIKKFTRDQLQADAPEAMDGYWQVPRLVE